MFVISMTLILLTLLIFLFLGGIFLFFIREWVLPKKLPFNPAGKHALVTGGSKGIGRAIVEQLLKSGCRAVSLFARDIKTLEKTRDELLQICEPHQSIHIFQADFSLSGPEEIKKIVEKSEEIAGPVDLLVNNVGTVAQGSFDQLPLDSFEHLMRTNYFSAVYMTRAVISGMKERQNGHIVFVSSAAGQFAFWGYSAYSPSKFALRALADSLHMELMPFGIGVTLLWPPNTDTEGFQEEKRTMPEQVRLISGQAGLFSPGQVASSLVHSIRNGEFSCSIGLEGQMLGLLTAGASPEPNLLKALAQIFLSGPIRLLMLILLAKFTAFVDNCHITSRKKEERIGEPKQ